MPLKDLFAFAKASSTYCQEEVIPTKWSIFFMNHHINHYVRWLYTHWFPSATMCRLESTLLKVLRLVKDCPSFFLLYNTRIWLDARKCWHWSVGPCRAYGLAFWKWLLLSVLSLWFELSLQNLHVLYGRFSNLELVTHNLQNGWCIYLSIYQKLPHPPL